MITLADSHCHIDAEEFDTDRDEVLLRARAAHVGALVVPAVAARGWDKLDTLCRAHDELHPAFGLHPIAIDEHRPQHLDALRDRLQTGAAVAVGECGLDYWDGTASAERQLHYFLAQLALAREFDLPVIVHARRSLDQVIACLRRTGGLRGVVHSFSGSWQQAEQLWRLDFMLGIGGPVTYPRAQRLRRSVAKMPIDHLLLETDSPDQPDSEHRGKRNEPARLTRILASVAELRGEDPTIVAAATTANCQRLFHLSMD